MTTSAQGITQNIAAHIGDDMVVYDGQGHRLGTVVDYSVAASILVVGKNITLDRDLYIPFSVVTHLDRDGLYVSLSKDALRDSYATAPPAAPTIERIVDQDQRIVATFSVLTTRNSDDGRPVVVARVDVDAVMVHLASGIAVYDARGSRLGTIKRLHRASAYLTIAAHSITRQVSYIPFGFIASFDPAGGGVSLALSKDQIIHEWSSRPAATVTTIELGSAAAGSTDRHTAMTHEDLDHMAACLEADMVLYDSAGMPAGRLNGYDAGAGYFLVAKGELFAQNLYIPLATVACVDLAGRAVYLAVSRDAMSRLFVMAPGSGPFDGLGTL